MSTVKPKFGKPKKGRVIYGTRAFHQDATEAMGGDIVRGLIETITNCDDAYGTDTGKILIEVERRKGPSKVITRDRATGMSAIKMEESFATLGGRTSGFEKGADVRGNLGRGAKDLAAFGDVEFESICDNEYVRLTLDPNGNYQLFPPIKPPPLEMRTNLGIMRGNGTIVTINVKENIRVPLHSTLVKKLSRHYQLRDIMANRDVTLVDLNSRTSDVLRYTFPELPIVFSADIEIENYPEATAKLIIYRNAERYDEPQSDPLRPAGILIKGRRAIYENTLFGFENNPFAGWFSGRLICPHIDVLAAEYDRRLDAGEDQDDKNPIPIITRRRDGLQRAHPFYKQLSIAVEKHLGKLISEEEKSSRKREAKESAQLRRTLNNLANDLSKLVDEDIREIDEEGLLGGKIGKKDPPLRVVPEEIVLYMGEDKTVSVIARQELCKGEVEVWSDPEGVVTIVDGSRVPLTPHKKIPSLLTGQIHLRPLIEDTTLLHVKCDDKASLALVEVRGEREIFEVDPEEIDHFQFERENYRVAWTKKKVLRSFATIKDVSHHGESVYISSSDPGVVIRGGNKITLKLDKKLNLYIGEVTVEARTLSSKATITANLGDLTASCNVVVTKTAEGPSLEIKMDHYGEMGNYRSISEQEENKTVIKIMGQHPIMKRYIGPAPDFPGENLPTTQLLIAEIVSDQVARMILEKKFPSTSGGEQVDAARFYVEHYRYMTKYLARCHKRLLPHTQLVDLSSVQVPHAEVS